MKETFDAELVRTEQPNISDTLNRLQENLSQVDNIIGNSATFVNNLGAMINSVQTAKVEMKKLDAQVEIYIKNTNDKTERFKNVLKVVEKQLDNHSKRVDKLLDQVFLIDTKTANTEEIKFRGELLKQVSNYSDSISELTYKILIY